MTFWASAWANRLIERSFEKRRAGLGRPRVILPRFTCREEMSSRRFFKRVGRTDSIGCASRSAGGLAACNVCSSTGRTITSVPWTATTWTG